MPDLAPNGLQEPPPTATAELPPFERSRWPARIVKALAVYSTAVVALITVVILVGSSDPRERAIILMALGLVVIWCLIGGLLQLRFRAASARGCFRCGAIGESSSSCSQARSSCSRKSSRLR